MEALPDAAAAGVRGDSDADSLLSQETDDMVLLVGETLEALAAPRTPSREASRSPARPSAGSSPPAAGQVVPSTTPSPPLTGERSTAGVRICVLHRHMNCLPRTAAWHRWL